jgi:hypothetical protein
VGEVEIQNINQVQKAFKAGVKDIPFILLAVDLIWWILGFFKINILDYWWIGEIFSHSLAFVAFMAFYAYLHRFCLYSWVCIIGLGLINILNLFHYFVNLNYIEVYSAIILITSLTFALIKWKTNYYFFSK